MDSFFYQLETSAGENLDKTRWNETTVEDLQGALAESLLFGDSTTVLLAFGAVSTLIDWLGLNLFEEVLEQQVLRFAFAEALSTAYFTNDTIRALGIGASPGLAALYGTDPKHTSAHGRALQDLAEASRFSRNERRRLARLVQEHSVLVERDLHNAAYDAARADIAGDIGTELAFPRGVNPDSGNLRDPYLRRYLNVAGANVNVQVAASLGCDNLIANKMTARVLDQRVSDALSTVGTHSADYRVVLQIERVPDLGSLLRAGKLSFERVVELSRSREAEEFRRWLGSVEPSDSAAVAREYQKELLRRTVDKPVVKTIKIVGYAGLGALPALIDPTAGIISSVVTSATLSTFDAFVLNALRRKWRPKVFLDKLKKL